MITRIPGTLSMVLVLILTSTVLAQESGPRHHAPPPRGPNYQRSAAGSMRPPVDRSPGGHPEPMTGVTWQAGILERVIENPKAVEELGLSEEQLAKLKKVTYDLKKAQITKRAELEVAAVEQARLLTDETSSEEAIMAAVEKTGAIRTDVAKLGMKRLLIIRETLTPEQQEKIKDMVHRHMQERKRGTARGANAGRDFKRDWQERRERMEQRRRGDGGGDGQPPAGPGREHEGSRRKPEADRDVRDDDGER